jgi:hypothetical protein
MNDLDSLLASVDRGMSPVTVGQQTLPIRPVTLVECLRAITRYPKIKAALFPADESEADGGSLVDVLLSDGPDAVGALLACAVGKPGDRAIEQKLLGLPDDILLPLLQAVVERTMPDGIESFFGRLTGLAGAAGLASQAPAA